MLHQENMLQKKLFLPNINIKYEGYQINNIRKPLTNLSCVQNYRELLNKKIWNSKQWKF